MNIEQIKEKLTQLQAALAEVVAAVENLSDTPETPAGVPLTPLERNPDGTESSPAWSKCNALWSAAQREGVFSMIAFVGGGIKPGAAHLTEKSPVTQREVEDKIVELGLSEWGRKWIADDRNAQYIGVPYCYLFTKARKDVPPVDPAFPNGYSVHRKYQYDESQGFIRKGA